MKTLGIIANCEKTQAAEAVGRIAPMAAKAGLRLLADEATSAAMGLRPPASLQAMLDRIEALMVLGGDGTLLRAVKDLAGRDVPVIGVNLGGLGFLTSVAEHDLERALNCIATDTFTTTQRSIGECSVERVGQAARVYRFLNDVAIASTSWRIVTLALAINGEEVSDSVCDGVVVSTPTGSTGHSLSAGGPVMLPTARAFVISRSSCRTTPPSAWRSAPARANSRWRSTGSPAVRCRWERASRSGAASAA